MELSPTELKHRIAGLNRTERRAQARHSWDLLELWRDPAYQHLSRQAARDQSWKDYWAMWRSDYQLSQAVRHHEVKPEVVKPEGSFWKGLKKFFGRG